MTISGQLRNEAKLEKSLYCLECLHCLLIHIVEADKCLHCLSTSVERFKRESQHDNAVECLQSKVNMVIY